MGLIGFVAGAVAKATVKDAAIGVTAAAADTVAHKIMPKDDEGTSLIDTPMMNIDTDSKIDVAFVGAGQIIHDTIHPNKPEDYKGGVPDVTFHEWQNDNGVQTLPTNNTAITIKQSDTKPDNILTIPKMVTDDSKASKSNEEDETIMTIPSFTSHL